MQRKQKALWLISLVLFAVYMVTLIHLLFFWPEYRYPGESYQYNLVPFQEIRRFAQISGFPAVMNLIGNVVAFVPFGLLLSPVCRDKVPTVAMIVLFLLFPVVVELLQLVTKVGVCDVDDVILNFAGEMIGLGFYRVVEAIVRRGLAAEQ